MLRSRTSLLRLSTPARPRCLFPASSLSLSSSRRHESSTATFKPFRPAAAPSAPTYIVDSNADRDAEINPERTRDHIQHGFGRRVNATLEKLVRKEKMAPERLQEIRDDMKMSKQARDAVEGERKAQIKAKKEKQKKLVKRRNAVQNNNAPTTWTMKQGHLLQQKKKHEERVMGEWDYALRDVRLWQQAERGILLAEPIVTGPVKWDYDPPDIEPKEERCSNILNPNWKGVHFFKNIWSKIPENEYDEVMEKLETIVVENPPLSDGTSMNVRGQFVQLSHDLPAHTLRPIKKTPEPVEGLKKRRAVVLSCKTHQVNLNVIRRQDFHGGPVRGTYEDILNVSLMDYLTGEVLIEANTKPAFMDLLPNHALRPADPTPSDLPPPKTRNLRDLLFQHIDTSTIVLSLEPLHMLETLGVSHPRIVNLQSYLLPRIGTNDDKYWSTSELTMSALTLRPQPTEGKFNTPYTIADCYGIRELALFITASKEPEHRDYWMWRRIRKNKDYLEQAARQGIIPENDFWTVENTKQFLRRNCPGMYYQMKMLLLTGQMRKWSKVGIEGNGKEGTFWRMVFLDHGERAGMLKGDKRDYEKRNDLWDVHPKDLKGWGREKPERYQRIVFGSDLEEEGGCQEDV